MSSAGQHLPDPVVGRADGFDPEVVLRADGGTMPPGATRIVRGATAVAGQAFAFRASGQAGVPEPALVNGAAGMVVRRNGRPQVVFGFTVVDGRIAEIDILADPERVAHLVLE